MAFSDDDFGYKVVAALKESGAVVITDVFPATLAEMWKQTIIGNFQELFPWLTDDPETWKTPNTGPQARRGLYQSLVCNLPIVWAIRTHEKIRQIFFAVYAGLRPSKFYDEFFTSIDGVNLCPPSSTSSYDPEKPPKDWAHLDQTSELNNPFKCVQGQVVLSDSSAGFVCSPGSHRLIRKILELAGVSESPDNWAKFDQTLYPTLKALVEEAGGQWQIPVQAGAGDVILWLSSTVHSAKIQDKGDETWRCVIYVCLRPKEECGGKSHAKRLRKCLEENRVTNHWVCYNHLKRNKRPFILTLYFFRGLECFQRSRSGLCTHRCLFCCERWSKPRKRSTTHFPLPTRLQSGALQCFE